MSKGSEGDGAAGGTGTPGGVLWVPPLLILPIIITFHPWLYFTPMGCTAAMGRAWGWGVLAGTDLAELCWETQGKNNPSPPEIAVAAGVPTCHRGVPTCHRAAVPKRELGKLRQGQEHWGCPQTPTAGSPALGGHPTLCRGGVGVTLCATQLPKTPVLLPWG